MEGKTNERDTSEGIGEGIWVGDEGSLYSLAAVEMERKK